MLGYLRRSKRKSQGPENCSQHLVFVPKPFTPFQWCALNGLEEQNRKREYLSGLLRRIKGVEYRWHGDKRHDY